MEGRIQHVGQREQQLLTRIRAVVIRAGGEEEAGQLEDDEGEGGEGVVGVGETAAARRRREGDW